MSNKRRVAYFYDGTSLKDALYHDFKSLDSVGNFYYGHDHPMKPKRIAMAHSLINNFKLYSLLHVYVITFHFIGFSYLLNF